MGFLSIRSTEPVSYMRRLLAKWITNGSWYSSICLKVLDDPQAHDERSQPVAAFFMAPSTFPRDRKSFVGRTQVMPSSEWVRHSAHRFANVVHTGVFCQCCAHRCVTSSVRSVLRPRCTQRLQRPRHVC